MNLQEFVSESLKQIMTGITNAQTDPANTGTINPIPRDGYAATQNIEFDVAVTVSQEKGTKGGIGIFVGAVGVGTQGQSESSNISVSRIKFSVPVKFSIQKDVKVH